MNGTILVGAAVIVLAAGIASPGAEKAISHRLLAVDTLKGKQGLHYVDEGNPTNDWSVSGNWRDIQLIGDHRVALSDLNGVSIVDMKTRKVVGTLRPRGLANVLSFRFMPNGHLVFNMTKRGLVVTDPLGIMQTDLVRTNANGLVRPVGDGGWTFTVMGDKGDYYATDVSADGFERARIRVHKSKPIYETCMLANGRYLVTAGYGGFAAEYRHDGEMEREYTTSNRFFFSGFQVLPNGNLVVANWTGHNEAERTKPNQGDQIVEFTPSGKVVWSYNNLERLGCIHGVIVLDDIDPALPCDQLHGRLVPMPGVGEAKVFAAIQSPANSLDGLAVLPDGAVAVSVPNLNDRKAEPVILKVAASGLAMPIASIKPGSGSERAVPFGMDVSPLGELFVADNQFFSERKPRPSSRLLAVRADGSVREVASGLCVANGVRVSGEYVYVTDSQLPTTGSNMIVSAVYRFPLRGEVVKLEGDPAKSPHLVVRFETTKIVEILASP